MQATASTFSGFYGRIDWLLVPRRGRRTSAIDVALQGLSVSAQLRSGPESGPIYTLSQSDDLWLAPKAGRVGRSASGPYRPLDATPDCCGCSPLTGHSPRVRNRADGELTVCGLSRCSQAFEQWLLLLECCPMTLIRWMAMYQLNGNLQAKDHLDQACVGACHV